MKPLFRFSLTAALRRKTLWGLLPLVAACFIAMAPPAYAIVDDSHSAAMEAAVDAVKDGFKIRQEYWNGTLKSGEKKIIRQQLFKGNEYWFFLGTDQEKVTMKVEVFDRKGTKVDVQTKMTENSAAVRVLAPSTGTYLVVFSLTTKAGEEIPWAVAYGYR